MYLEGSTVSQFCSLRYSIVYNIDMLMYDERVCLELVYLIFMTNLM